MALGRRNWTFAGSDAGGHPAAAVYSLIETAKLHGLDPEAYLRHVIGRIADHTVNLVDELLPWHLAGLPARLDQRLSVHSRGRSHGRSGARREWALQEPDRTQAAGSNAIRSAGGGHLRGPVLNRKICSAKPVSVRR